MSNISIEFIVTTVSLLFMWYLIQSRRKEGFIVFPKETKIDFVSAQTLMDIGTLPLRSKVHIALKNDDTESYRSFKPPSAHGNHGCTQVPCPRRYADDRVCWSCCNFH